MEEKRIISVDNLIILDKSGSMSSIHHAALTGVNETLGGIRSAAKKYADSQKQYVTLVLFCACELTYIYDHTPIEDVKDLTEKQYIPCCSTPLYDAMGKSVNKLRGKIEKEDDTDHTVLVTVVTDGLENASKEYSGKMIHDLVSELKTKGWVFNYIGTDHDVESVAATLNITNIIHFSKNEEDTRRTFAREARAKARFFDRLEAVGGSPMGSAVEREAAFSQLGENFYDEDDENNA
jgi:hypothetical protein